MKIEKENISDWKKKPKDPPKNLPLVSDLDTVGVLSSNMRPL
jgi:hypothetical protein